MRLNRMLPLIPPLLIGACATVPPAPPAIKTPVPIYSSSGGIIGAATWWADPAGTHIDLRVSGLTPGPHGVHLHSVGTCDGPGFTTAGGHWNPTSRQHGHSNPGGWHLGDLGNINVRSDGTEQTMLMLPAGTDVADADGTALVIHAGADDERTDPSGNSGGRIACAVVAPAR